MALEDAANIFPVTRMLMRRLSDTEAAVGCIIDQAGVIAKESGEAVAAILKANKHTDHRAQAIAEVDEAIVALRAARDWLEMNTQPVGTW